MEYQQFPAPQRQDSPVAGRKFPRIELREIGPAGMVIRVESSMQPGTALALGVHLPGAGHRKRFMDLEGIVVDCRRVHEGDEALAWEVILLFPHLTASQTRALRSAQSRVQACPEAPKYPLAGSGLTWAERDLSAWCGVN